MKVIRRRKRAARALDVRAIEIAIERLREARWELRFAKASRAADYVQRALKSAQGARNHAQAMLTRQERQA